MTMTPAASEAAERWYDAPEDNCHAEIFTFVRRIDQEQGDYYDRLALLESLYDPHSPTGDENGSSVSRLMHVTENVIASNVDATYAAVATADVRARFLTDGAEWSTQRRAKKLESYTEALAKQLDAHRKCRLAFREAGKVGAGLVKVYADRWRRPTVDHVRLQDIYVPDEDSRTGQPPLQLHHVQRNYDAAKLKAEYPDAEDEIDRIAAGGSVLGYQLSQPIRTPYMHRRKLTVIESIRLPIGKRPPPGQRKNARTADGKRGARYVPGRRVVTIENKTLLDEEYHKDFYPFAVQAWSERQGSFYPISGAERVAGIQNELNKRNWQINRTLDQTALVTYFMRPADMNASIKTNKIGNFVVLKGDPPVAPVLPSVHPETYKSRQDLKASAPGEFGGLGQLAVQGSIPAGLETGEAVRQFRQASSQKIAPQEADFEQLALDVYFLLVDVCKDLGADAPDVLESRWHKPLKWSEVDLGHVKIQLSAASTLPREAAGREQTVLEWAQAGILSTDSTRQVLTGTLDIDREISLYTSAVESIDQQIEIILDGGISTPEPFDNLGMIAWRGTGAFHNARIGGAPEEVLENLRDYITNASFILSQRQAQNANAAPGAPPMPDAGMNAPPDAGTPSAALAPQAMQLRATAAA